MVPTVISYFYSNIFITYSSVKSLISTLNKLNQTHTLQKSNQIFQIYIKLKGFSIQTKNKTRAWGWQKTHCKFFWWFFKYGWFFKVWNCTPRVLLINTVKKAIPQINLQMKWNLWVPVDFFVGIHKVVLKFMWNCKRPGITKNNF